MDAERSEGLVSCEHSACGDFCYVTARVTAVAGTIRRDSSGYVLPPAAVSGGFAERILSRLFRVEQPPLSRMTW